MDDNEKKTEDTNCDKMSVKYGSIRDNHASTGARYEKTSKTDNKRQLAASYLMLLGVLPNPPKYAPIASDGGFPCRPPEYLAGALDFQVAPAFWAVPVRPIRYMEVTVA